MKIDFSREKFLAEQTSQAAPIRPWRKKSQPKLFDPQPADAAAPNDCLASALSYANRGWCVFPADLTGGVKKSHKSAKYSDGANWGSTKDPEQIKKDFSKWPEAIGIPTGAVNQFFVIEADTKEAHGVDGLASLEALQAMHGRLPETLMAESPTGSLHRYYRHPGQYITNSSSKIAPGVDIKGDGGMVIAPPSKRADDSYRWLNDLPIAEAPAWLVEQAVAAGQQTEAAANGGEASEKWRNLFDNLRNGDGLHDTLRDLAAKMITGGMSGGATTNMLYGWHDLFAPEGKWKEPRDDIPRAVATAEEKFAEGKARTRPPLCFINMANWDNEPVPQRKWAVHEKIPLQQTTLHSGQGAVGKSLIELHRTVAHVLGREWLGSWPEPGKAVFIDAEDDENELHIRLAAIASYYGVKFSDLIAGGLHVKTLVGADAVLAAPKHGSNIIEPTALYDQIFEFVADIKPKSITIASSANVFAGNENDRSQVQQCVSLFTRLAMIANGCVVLISHPSVRGIDSDTGLSGTTQWHNSVRARYYSKGVKPRDGEPVDTDLRVVEFRKNNYGPISSSITLRYDSGLFLPVSDDDTSFDKAEREATADDIFLQLLKLFCDQGQDVGPGFSRNYAPNMFARHPDAAGFTKNDLAKAMQRLLDAKTVVIEDYGPKSRPAKRLKLA